MNRIGSANGLASLELLFLSIKICNAKINYGLLGENNVWNLVTFNTLRPRQNGRHFPDIFKCIFLNENAWISLKISLKFVPKGPNNKIAALVQIMAWHLSGDKSLSEPMMVSLLTHKCVTRPQWAKKCFLQILLLLMLSLSCYHIRYHKALIHYKFSLTSAPVLCCLSTVTSYVWINETCGAP